jgi:thioredoxin 1
MLIEKINQANFGEKVLASKIPVIVVFSAVWCNPCRLLAPSLEELALENTERVIFYSVDTDENPNLIKKYGIRDLPAFLFFKNGSLELFEKGQKSKLKLQSLLDISLLSE